MAQLPLKKTVKQCGHSAHIILPKTWANKQVWILLNEDPLQKTLNKLEVYLEKINKSVEEILREHAQKK